MRPLRVPVSCWNAKKRRLLHPPTSIITRGETTKRANSSDNARTTTASSARVTSAATTNNAIRIRVQFRRQPVRALSTRNRTGGTLKLKVLELEAFDRLDSHSDSIDTHTGTRKRKQHKPGTTLYIGDDTTKSWKVLAFGKDEDEEQSSVTSSSDQELTQKQKTAPLSLSKSLGNLQQTFHNNVIQHFLPAHFPNSVAPGYARFTSFGFCASGTYCLLIYHLH
jgi:hypothetical protein